MQLTKKREREQIKADYERMTGNTKQFANH